MQEPTGTECETEVASSAVAIWNCGKWQIHIKMKKNFSANCVICIRKVFRLSAIFHLWFHSGGGGDSEREEEEMGEEAQERGRKKSRYRYSFLR